MLLQIPGAPDDVVQGSWNLKEHDAWQQLRANDHRLELLDEELQVQACACACMTAAWLSGAPLHLLGWRAGGCQGLVAIEAA